MTLNDHELSRRFVKRIVYVLVQRLETSFGFNIFVLKLELAN